MRTKTGLLLLLMLSANLSFAQPSDAEIRKQITNDGTKSIKFTKSTGTRQWNKDIGNWEWVRGVEVTRKSEYPGIDLLVTGDVVYQYTGVGKYSYWKFRTISNQYFGLPNPNQKEIDEVISKNWERFYGYYYEVITKLWAAPALANEPQWTWHNPNSVEFKMKIKFDQIIRGKGIETAEGIWNVRLYRDDPKGQWKKMIASRSQEADDIKVIGMQSYTPQQLQDFEKQTLKYTMAEQIAQKDADALSKTITVPEFNRAEQLFQFVHDILRNGDPEKFRAVMLQVMAPGFFVEGSKVQLSDQEEQNLQNVITAAYNNKATYKQMYCQNPEMKVERWGNSNTKKTITISALVNNCNTQFIIDQVNMGYKEGVPQTKLRILSYGIYVRQDNDAIDYINSFSDRKKICPSDL